MNPFGEMEAAAGQTAAAYAEKKWGGPTRLVPVNAVGISGAATRVLLNNPRRLEWMIVNPLVFNVWIDFSADKLSQSSFLISPVGGSIVLLLDEDAELITSEVWAASAGGVGNISVWEVIRK